MAKMKTFAVEVEVTVKTTLFVTTRRQGGAIAVLETEHGWKNATRYSDPCGDENGSCNTIFNARLGENAKITNIREMGT